MTKATVQQLKAARLTHANPYAFVNGEGNLEALCPIEPAAQASCEATLKDRLRLRNPAAHIDGNGELSALEVSANYNQPNHAMPSFRVRGLDDLEDVARYIQNAMYKAGTATHSPKENLVEFLNPKNAITHIGYHHVQHSGYHELKKDFQGKKVGAYIDQANKTIGCIAGLPPEVERFTLAHEVAHAVLDHHEGVMHRDAPISGAKKSRDFKEQQADRFAGYLLMPRKQLTLAVKGIFGSAPFLLTEDSTFGMSIEGKEVRVTDSMSLSDKARILAAVDTCMGRPLVPLYKYFKVSHTAMAIQLELYGLAR